MKPHQVHHALQDWAEGRKDILESLGWPGRSTLGRMIEQGPGAGSSGFGDPTAASVGRPEVRDVLYSETAYNALEPEHRLLIQVCYLWRDQNGDALRQEQIARTLEVSVRTLQRRLRRARRAFLEHRNRIAPPGWDGLIERHRKRCR